MGFSGAPHHANEAPGAGYYAALDGESEETGLGGGARWIRTLGATRVFTREIRPDFGAIFDLTKGIFVEENLFAWHSTLLRLSPARFVSLGRKKSGSVGEKLIAGNSPLISEPLCAFSSCWEPGLATLGADF